MSMNIIEFITANLSTIIALAATGVVAGILAGLLGVGGGIVIVPVLYFLFQMGTSKTSIKVHSFIWQRISSPIQKYN